MLKGPTDSWQLSIRGAGPKLSIQAAQSVDSGQVGKGPGQLGHKRTFLQLHTLEVEGVPQDVAAAWLVLLGEQQQVRIGKQRHLCQARANRTGSSAVPGARNHNLPKGPGKESSLS